MRFGSVQALARGEGFRVIEINGVGSEATHVWDPATPLLEAWRAQFFHYGAAFRIAAANRARGHNPARLRALWRHWRQAEKADGGLSDERLTSGGAGLTTRPFGTGLAAPVSAITRIVGSVEARPLA